MTIASLHCPRCGAALTTQLFLHLACKQNMGLEPPRYCVSCGRRMKVQVLPDGWRAECREHGVLTSAPS